MPSSFPDALDNLPTNKADETPAAGDHAAHHNALAEAVNAIQEALLDGLVGGIEHHIDVTKPPYNCTGAIDQTDAGTRINAAIEDASEIGTQGTNTLAGGTKVLVPPGLYVADVPIAYREGVWIDGFGPKATVILRKANTDTKLLVPATLAENTWRVSNLRFDGNRGNQTVAQTALEFDRSAVVADGIPGFLAGPAVAGFVSALFGGGDLIGLENIIVSNVLGKGMTFSSQCSQWYFRDIFVWFTSDHGIDGGGVDNEFVGVQVGNTGKCGWKNSGTNNRLSHIKLYETDVVNAGWGAMDLEGSKNRIAALEVQEAGSQGIRVYGSDNAVDTIIDGCRGVGLDMRGGSRNRISAHVQSFPAYAPTWLCTIGNGVVGNWVDLIGRQWSEAPLKGAIAGNEIRLNGSLI